MAGKATKEGKRMGKKGQEGHFKEPNQISEPKRGEIWLGQRRFDRNRNFRQRTKVGPARFIAEIPGIEVESDYAPIKGPKSNTEPEVKSSYSERAKNERKNAGRKTDVVTQFKTRGVDNDEDDDSIIEIEESDDESDVGVYPVIKQ